MRDDQLKTIAALSAAALAAALAGPAAAKDVKVDVDGKFYQLPEGAKNNLDAVRVLLTAANGLGMARVATWQNEITENDGSRMSSAAPPICTNTRAAGCSMASRPRWSRSTST